MSQSFCFNYNTLQDSQKYTQRQTRTQGRTYTVHTTQEQMDL